MQQPITFETLLKWKSALHTQYQIREDAIVARHCDDAPTLEQLCAIRDAHLSIIPLVERCLEAQEKTIILETCK